MAQAGNLGHAGSHGGTGGSGHQDLPETVAPSHGGPLCHDYEVRCANKPSEIATGLKGEPVFCPADLVYVGTTSLYYVGSSQYNRLKIPGKVFDSDFGVVWKQLGMTRGGGTMHISKKPCRSDK